MTPGSPWRSSRAHEPPSPICSFMGPSLYPTDSFPVSISTSTVPPLPPYYDINIERERERERGPASLFWVSWNVFLHPWWFSYIYIYIYLCEKQSSNVSNMRTVDFFGGHLEALLVVVIVRRQLQIHCTRVIHCFEHHVRDACLGGLPPHTQQKRQIQHHGDSSSWWLIMMNHHDSSCMMNHHDPSWWIITTHHDGSSWWIILNHHDDESQRVKRAGIHHSALNALGFFWIPAR